MLVLKFCYMVTAFLVIIFGAKSLLDKLDVEMKMVFSSATAGEFLKKWNN